MPKHRPAKRGQFRGKCGCLLHKEKSSSDISLHPYPSTKLLSKSSEHFLKRYQYMNTWSKYICESCIEHTQELQKEEQSNTGPSKCLLSNKEAATSHQEAEELQNSPFNDHLKLISDLIESDLKELSKQGCPTLDDLSRYNPKSWLADRPSELISFLTRICNIDTLDDKNSYLVAKLVEQLYHIHNSKVTLPLSERESILCYSLTTSKIFSNFQAHTSPSSSYWHLIQTLDQSASCPVPFPAGVTRYAFDNNQVIGKTYIIRGGENNVPTSIITSSLYAEINDSKLQENVELKPTQWMFQKPTPDNEQNITALTDKYDNFFRTTRDKRISSTIEEVIQEINVSTDHIDDLVEEQNNVNNYKLCASCGAENIKTYRVCRNCQGPLVNQPPVNIKTEDEQPFKVYECFEDVNVIVNDATVVPGEPDFVNPNSFENISTLLRNVGKRAGIAEYGGSRQWLLIECDGQPYTILRSLIDNVWKCPNCRSSFYDLESFNAHFCHLLKKAEGYREFDWIVPVVGLLHLEINAARSFLKLNWAIFIKDIAYVLGFKSERAQKYCERGSDHHKTWDLLEILYSALSKELLVPYIVSCNNEGSIPSTEGYWRWSESVRNMTYLYIQQMTYTFLHSLLLFRTGVRRNNKHAIDAAKSKFVHLFYGQHHPKYQLILFRDMVDEVNMPDELSELIASSYTMSRTHNEGHYQGGDALQEEINKEGKSWLKVAGGTPNDSRWRRIFRNLTKLKKIRESTLNDAGMEKAGTSANRPTRNHHKEVVIARAAIRKVRYLSSPMEPIEMTSLGGSSDICNELVNFSVHSKTQTRNYFMKNIHGEGSVMEEVCVTSAQREKRNRMQTMSCIELQALIRDELLKLQPSQAAGITSEYSRICNTGTRHEHIMLLYDILEELETSETVSEELGAPEPID